MRLLFIALVASCCLSTPAHAQVDTSTVSVLISPRDATKDISAEDLTLVKSRLVDIEQYCVDRTEASEGVAPKFLDGKALSPDQDVRVIEAYKVCLVETIAGADATGGFGEGVHATAIMLSPAPSPN